MKVLAIFFGLLALSTALPQQNVVAPAQETDVPVEGRIIGDAIAAVIESISQMIKDEGFDPYHLERFAVGYAIPVPILFDASAHIADLVVNGISEIIIQDISFGLFNNRLTLDIVLPRIAIAVGDAGLDLTILGVNLDAATNFNFAIVNARVAGYVQMNVGIITGIFVREVNLDFSLGGLEFNGSVEVAGFNLSPQITDFITRALPNQLNLLRNDINELINIVVYDIANSIL